MRIACLPGCYACLPAALAVAGWGSAVSYGAPAAAPDARALLRAMAVAQRTVAYSGSGRVERRGAPAIVMRVWRQGARRRVEYLSPPIRRGDLIVDDGANVWQYRHADNAAVQTRKAASGGGEDAERPNQHRDVKVVGTGRVAGRAAWIVTVSRHGMSAVTRRIWIDRLTHARLRVERFGPSGQRLEVATLHRVRFGPVPASRFVWAAPPGSRLTRTSGTLYGRLAQALQAAPWLQVPHYMPRGYTFEGALVNPGGEAWLRFSNGLHRFSLFQQRASTRAEKTPRQVNGAWYWQHGATRFLAVGLNAMEVARLAAR